MTRGFFTGLFVGMLFGMLGALVLAPMEGSIVRGKVKDAASSTRKGAKSIAADVRHKAHNTADTIKQSI